jgi:hypothetical protein
MVPSSLTALLLAAVAVSGAGFPVEDAALEAAGAVIGEVRIETADIFDPDDPAENRWLYRAANAVHRVTRPRVIRRLLLFEPGDLYVAARVRESERLLRSQRYLYDAVIEPTRFADGKVDLVVRTRDVWTLTVGAGLGRSGGRSTTRIGIEDSNFFGTGKELTIRRVQGIERDEALYRYRDPAVGGSRVEIQASHSDNSDGAREALAVRRPFFSLDTRWAVSFDGVDDDRIVPLYERGEVVDRFRERRSFAEVWGGFAPVRRGARAQRWRAGFTWERARFSDAAGFPAASALPAERRLAFPWVGFETVEDRFLESHDLDRIARTEDLNLAREFRARLGVSAHVFGGDRTRVVYDVSSRAGWAPTSRQLLFAAASLTGRAAGGADENRVASASVRWFVRDFGRHAFFASLRGNAAWRLDGERQLLLGGDNGLRGYPLRYVGGDRSWLFTVEQRFYTDWHVWRLIHVGAAVFADVGSAWTSGAGSNELGVLRDLGFGLRLGSSRSAQGAMLHVDWAFAFDGGPSIRRSQLLITNRETF